MMALCLRYVRDRQDAVEVLNDCFLKIFRYLSRYDPQKGALYTWMRTIVINTALDSLRRRKSERRPENLPDNDEGPGIDNEALSRLSGDELLNLIHQLPVTTRLVFCLFVIDGYSHREIAVLLGINEGTSRWYVNDARRQLKTMADILGKRI
jgi:RNA polymerase sigma-70 factor (ECF subfamily)